MCGGIVYLLYDFPHLKRVFDAIQVCILMFLALLPQKPVWIFYFNPFGSNSCNNFVLVQIRVWFFTTIHVWIVGQDALSILSYLKLLFELLVQNPFSILVLIKTLPQFQVCSKPVWIYVWLKTLFANWMKTLTFYGFKIFYMHFFIFLELLCFIL